MGSSSGQVTINDAGLYQVSVVLKYILPSNSLPLSETLLLPYLLIVQSSAVPDMETAAIPAPLHMEVWGVRATALLRKPIVPVTRAVCSNN